MPQIKIPDSLKKFFRKEGIDDLPRILELLATVNPVIVINSPNYPNAIFPGGKRRIIKIAATAGNVITNLSPGSGKRWLVLFGDLTLVCDATVATRYMQLSTTDGTNLTQSFPGLAPVASETKNISYNQTVEHLTAVAVTADAHVAIGNNIILEGADQLRITINAGVAGDSYSGFFVVLEVDV